MVFIDMNCMSCCRLKKGKSSFSKDIEKSVKNNGGVSKKNLDRMTFDFGLLK